MSVYLQIEAHTTSTLRNLCSEEVRKKKMNNKESRKIRMASNVTDVAVLSKALS